MSSSRSFAVRSTGLSGATAGARFVGGTTSGPPTTGAWLVGDEVTDQTGTNWICISAGTPGTWVETGSRPGTVHYALQNGWHPLLPYGQGADLTVTAGRGYALPLRVDRSGTITGVAVHVVTAGSGSSVARLGLYFDNGSNAPGSRIADWGTVSLTSAGVKTITGLTQGFVGGTHYWLEVAPQTVTGTPALKAVNASHPLVASTSAPTDLGAYASAYYSDTGHTGALPDPFGAVAGITQCPAVSVKLQ